MSRLLRRMGEAMRRVIVTLTLIAEEDPPEVWTVDHPLLTVDGIMVVPVIAGFLEDMAKQLRDEGSAALLHPDKPS